MYTNRLNSWSDTYRSVRPVSQAQSFTDGNGQRQGRGQQQMGRRYASRDVVFISASHEETPLVLEAAQPELVSERRLIGVV